MNDNYSLYLCLIINGIGWMLNGAFWVIILTKSSLWIKHDGKEVVLGEKAIKELRQVKEVENKIADELKNRNESLVQEVKDLNEKLKKVIEKLKLK